MTCQICSDAAHRVGYHSNECKHVGHSCSITNVKKPYNFDISKDVFAVCRTGVSIHAVCAAGIKYSSSQSSSLRILYPFVEGRIH